MSIREEYIADLKRAIDKLDNQITQLTMERNTLMSILDKYNESHSPIAIKNSIPNYDQHTSIIGTIRRLFNFKVRWRPVEIRNQLDKLIKEGIISSNSGSLLHLVHSNIRELLKQGYIKKEVASDGTVYYYKSPYVEDIE